MLSDTITVVYESPYAHRPVPMLRISRRLYFMRAIYVEFKPLNMLL
jgi:hypothetical protein